MQIKSTLSLLALATALAAGPVFAGGGSSDNAYSAYGDSVFSTGSGVTVTADYSRTRSGSDGDAASNTYVNTQRPAATADAGGEVDYFSRGMGSDDSLSIISGGGFGVSDSGAGVLKNGNVVKDEEAEGYSAGNYGALGEADGRHTSTWVAGSTDGGAQSGVAANLNGSSYDAAKADNHTGVAAGAEAYGRKSASTAAEGAASSESEASEVENGSTGS